MSVPLHFEPYESVFVVFAKHAGLERDRIIAVTRNGEALLNTKPSEAGAAAVNGKSEEAVAVVRGEHRELSALVREPGKYAFTQANGGSGEFGFAEIPAALELSGPWQVDFAPGGGAPARLTCEKLMSWSESTDQGVKYFSGCSNLFEEL